VIQRPGFVRDVCFLLAILLTSTATVWAAMSFLSLYAACILLVWTSHCCAAATVDITEAISPSVVGAV
jgi:sodium/potassium/calcium exchanger 6